MLTNSITQRLNGKWVCVCRGPFFTVLGGKNPFQQHNNQSTQHNVNVIFHIVEKWAFTPVARFFEAAHSKAIISTGEGGAAVHTTAVSSKVCGQSSTKPNAELLEKSCGIDGRPQLWQWQFY